MSDNSIIGKINEGHKLSFGDISLGVKSDPWNFIPAYLKNYGFFSDLLVYIDDPKVLKQYYDKIKAAHATS